ncbi:MAG: hypothetical protein K8R21_13770 [Leptospira sp.]|nr:hypothetical protein [Leptospira sp.]
MNQKMSDLIQELKSIVGYAKLFEKAYPGKGMTPGAIAKAIATFEGAVVSKDSALDS